MTFAPRSTGRYTFRFKVGTNDHDWPEMISATSDMQACQKLNDRLRLGESGITGSVVLCDDSIYTCTWKDGRLRAEFCNSLKGNRCER